MNLYVYFKSDETVQSGWCVRIKALRHSAVSHVVLWGRPLSSSLLQRQSFSLPVVRRGCIKGPRFSTQPTLALSCKTSARRGAGELLHEGTRVNSKRSSASELVCRSWLDAKTGRFPNSGAEKSLLFVDKRPSHPVCWLALHSTLCRGVSQCKKNK